MRYRFQVRDEIHEVTLERGRDGLRAAVDGQVFALEVLDEQEGLISLRLDGKPVSVHWAMDDGQKWVSLGGCAYRIEKPAVRRRAAGGEAAGGERVRAPMPAQVREVLVAEGDRVEKGQTLLLLEAMKMEIRLRAQAGGVVRRLQARAGQTVEKDQVLAEIGEGQSDGG